MKQRMPINDRIRLQIAAVGSLVLISCGQATKSVQSSGGTDATYAAAPGEEATQFFQKKPGGLAASNSTLTQSLNIAAAEHAATKLALGSTGPLVHEMDEETLNHLHGLSKHRREIKVSSYPLPNIDTVWSDTKLALLPKYESQTVDLASTTWAGQSTILIPNRDKIPVKDQGPRPTCCAFAVAGALEYVIQRTYASHLDSVDLSEQRLYMIAKDPSQWTNTSTEWGSSPGRAVQQSYGLNGISVPSNDPAYNIPIEKDCPYTPSNDPNNQLQFPQPDTCLRGVVRVTAYGDWGSSQGPSGSPNIAPSSAQDIFDHIKNVGTPVIVATPLDNNWRSNNGLITKAKSLSDKALGTLTSGHCYLIVGVKKIDEAKHPGEGGMCFVIKNSWGPGYGVGGYSCMTLAWFNWARQYDSHVTVVDAAVDMPYLKAGYVPPVNQNPTTQFPPNQLPPTPENTPTPVSVIDPGKQKVDTKTVPVDPTPSPTKAVQTKLLANGFTLAAVIDFQGNHRSIMYKTDGASITLQGIYDNADYATNPLTLPYSASDGKIGFEYAKAGQTLTSVAGTLKNDVIELCSGQHSSTCHFNLIKSSNDLVIHPSQGHFASLTPAPHANWQTIGTKLAASYVLQYWYEAPNPFIDLRIGGQSESQEIRLLVDENLKIIHHGIDIGAITDHGIEFCTGSFKDVCHVALDTTNARFEIIFKVNNQG